MNRNVLAMSILPLLVFANPAAVAADDAPHEIRGTVVDDDGRGIPGVYVGLLDQATGQPVDAATGALFREMMRRPSGQAESDPPPTWSVATTDEEGEFTFSPVKPGTYRLAAQSSNESAPDTRKTELGSIPALEFWHTRRAVVHVRGAADHVVVPSPDSLDVTLAPLGTGTLDLAEKNGNGNWYGVVSTSPLGGDPVLYFAAWDANFLSHAIATVTSPAHGPLIIRGLPAGEIYIGLFFNDNRPGSAGDTAVIEPGRTATLRPQAIAGWSDGRKDPPPHLEPLMNKLIQQQWDLEDLLGELPEGSDQRFGLFHTEALDTWGPLDRQVELPDGSTATVADVLAASAYRMFRRYKR